MSARDPIAFLDAVAGYAAERNGGGSADRPIKIATVDPAYVPSTFPSTLPKVTFEGESTLSGKRYPVMSGYLPRPSDRVLMLPAGNTYVILGSLDADTVAYHGDGYYSGDATVWEANENTNDTTTSTSYTNVTTCGTAFVAPTSGVVSVHIAATLATNNTTVAGAVTFMSFEVRAGSSVGSGTVFLAASDNHSFRILTPSTDAGFKYAGGARKKVVSGLTPGSSYNARMLFRVTASTGAYIGRSIVVEHALGPLG